MTICNCYDVVFLSVLPGSIKLHTLCEKRCVDTYLHFKVWCFDGIPFNRKDDISNGPYVSMQKRKKKKGPGQWNCQCKRQICTGRRLKLRDTRCKDCRGKLYK